MFDCSTAPPLPICAGAILPPPPDVAVSRHIEERAPLCCAPSPPMLPIRSVSGESGSERSLKFSRCGPPCSESASAEASCAASNGKKRCVAQRRAVGVWSSSGRSENVNARVAVANAALATAEGSIAAIVSSGARTVVRCIISSSQYRR